MIIFFWCANGLKNKFSTVFVEDWMKTRKIHSHINVSKICISPFRSHFKLNIYWKHTLSFKCTVRLSSGITSLLNFKLMYLRTRVFTNPHFSYKNRICEFRIQKHEHLFHYRGLNKLITELYINSNFPAFPCLQENPILTIKMWNF